MVNKIVVIIMVIASFTLLDYFGHQYLEKNAGLEVVPKQYYTHKIIFGSAILLIFVDKITSSSGYLRVFWLTSIVVLLLQLRYYSTYSPKFNQYVLFLHYLTLVPLIYFTQERRLL